MTDRKFNESLIKCPKFVLYWIKSHIAFHFKWKDWRRSRSWGKRLDERGRIRSLYIMLRNCGSSDNILLFNYEWNSFCNISQSTKTNQLSHVHIHTYIIDGKSNKVFSISISFMSRLSAYYFHFTLLIVSLNEMLFFHSSTANRTSNIPDNSIFSGLQL